MGICLRIVDVEDWNGEIVDYVTVLGELVPFIEFIDCEEDYDQKEIAVACGYVPVNEFLHQEERIVDTIPVGNEYFGLTSRNRLIFVSHWYGDSSDILVPNVARTVEDILNNENKDLADAFVNAIYDLIFAKVYSTPVRLLSWERPNEKIWDMLIDVVKFDGYIKDRVKMKISRNKEIFESNFHQKDESKKSNAKDSGVYFISADNGLTKIGRTSNLKKRLSELRTSSPCILNLIWFIGTDSEIEIEKQMHNVFEEKRIRGEWFLLSKEDLDWVKQFN